MEGVIRVGAGNTDGVSADTTTAEFAGRSAGERTGSRATHRRPLKSPGTFAYLLAVVVMWGCLEAASSRQAEHVIDVASTNVHNMVHAPARVLFASAFVIDPDQLWITVIELLAVMAYVERRLGTLRTFAVFVTGHIGATVITVSGIGLAIHAGWAAPSLAHAPDVGVSYGLVAVAAAATFGIANHALRAATICAMATYLVVALCVGRSFTDCGHLLAFAIGFAVYPLVRRR